MTTIKKKPLRWRLRVHYWTNKRGCPDIIETFAAGSTKKQTLQNWFFQYYHGDVPENPCIPKDAVNIEWIKYRDWTRQDIEKTQLIKRKAFAMK
jgi:hypothetical protein